MASQILSFLPQSEGLLPKWLLFISIVSIANSIQAYASLAGTREVYAGPAPRTTKPPPGIPPATLNDKNKPTSNSPVTPLSARTFGTWTAITSIVRLYAAYNIHDKVVYELALWTYVVAWAHFASELFVFKTARLGRGIAGPVVVATGSLVWMVSQWGAYVQ